MNLARVFTAAVLALPALAAKADPITFYVCDNPTFKRNGEVIELWCPGKTAPTLRFVGCVGPKITRNGQKYTLTCARWGQS